MKRIIITENQFNMLLKNSIFENLSRQMFSYDANVLLETRGVPNEVDKISSDVFLMIKSSIKEKKLSGSINLSGAFENWKVEYYCSLFIDSNGGVTRYDKKTIRINIMVDENLCFNELNLSEIIGHELMHVYQFYLNTNTVFSKEDKYEMYSKMREIFEKVSNNETNPFYILNYIIYYSFTEEQEAYTVGVKEYFKQFSIEDFKTNDDYKEIIKSNPFYIVFERLGKAKTLLNGYEFYEDVINEFCALYGIKYKDLVKMLNESIVNLKYKFQRVLADFFIENNVSFEDRKKFMIF